MSRRVTERRQRRRRREKRRKRLTTMSVVHHRSFSSSEMEIVTDKSPGTSFWIRNQSTFAFFNSILKKVNCNLKQIRWSYQQVWEDRWGKKGFLRRCREGTSQLIRGEGWRWCKVSEGGFNGGGMWVPLFSPMKGYSNRHVYTCHVTLLVWLFGILPLI